MSKKDYEVIAKAIREQADIAAWQKANPDKWDGNEPFGRRMAVIQIATAVADVMEADNPRFDRNRFMTACGVI